MLKKVKKMGTCDGQKANMWAFYSKQNIILAQPKSQRNKIVKGKNSFLYFVNAAF